MTHAADLPPWAALLTALFVVIGAALTFTGSLGLLRLGSFYDRVHAPTLGATLGTGSVLLGSMICFSVLQTRPVLHEILIGVFLTATTPVGLMLLVRAALYRDRSAGVPTVPARGGLPGETGHGPPGPGPEADGGPGGPRRS